MAAGIRPTSSSRPRTQTYSLSWTSTTCRPQNPEHAITWRSDPCASYRTQRGGPEEGRLGILLKGVTAGGGRTQASGVSRTTDRPPFSLHKHMLGLQNQEGAPEEDGPVIMQRSEIRLHALISLWKTIISFFFRDLSVWYKTWTPRLEGSNMNVSSCHLSDYVVSYSLHGPKPFQKRSVQKYGTVTNAIIPILMFKYYLYMYMYCIL